MVEDLDIIESDHFSYRHSTGGVRPFKLEFHDWGNRTINSCACAASIANPVHILHQCVAHCNSGSFKQHVGLRAPIAYKVFNGLQGGPLQL